MPTATKEEVITYGFSPRGIGNSWQACFICDEEPLGDGGGEGSCNDDMASFVASMDDGERIVSLFADLGCTALLDYRDYEPNWIQVKLATCRAHWPSLRLLEELCSKEGTINAKIIKECLPKARVPRDTRG
jgi:hypothetical protein